MIISQLRPHFRAVCGALSVYTAQLGLRCPARARTDRDRICCLFRITFLLENAQLCIDSRICDRLLFRLPADLGKRLYATSSGG